MKRKIISLLMSICLVVCTTAWGDVAFAGTTYKSDSDTAYPVTGGSIYFNESTGTITACDTRVTEAVIPEQINGVAVTSIGAHAFDSNHLLESIEIPKSIKSIEKYAFYNCSKLNSVEISEGVENIEEAAFQMCRSLESIEIPESVTKLGKSAFEYCEKLVSVNNLSKIESISNRSFYECRKLASINIPTSVTTIGENAFSFCESLISIEMPSNLKSIGYGAFSACTSLETLDIPASVTDIGDAAFTVTKLHHVIIPSGIKSIGAVTFYSCDSLTTVEIPITVESIAEGAFGSCSSLESINIPSGVKTIGDGAFSLCSKLKSINVDSGNQAYMSADGCLYNKAGTELIACPAGKESVSIQSGVKKIGASAFTSCKLLTSVEIPDGTESIGEYAFYYCSLLQSIEIPASVTSISSSAFSGCSNLQYIIGVKGSYAETFAKENNITFIATHTHCICAKTAEAAGSSSIGDHTAHTDITFTAWTDELAAEQNGEGKNAANSLPSTAGNYYLTSNVTLSSVWWCTGNITICLNGKDIECPAVGVKNSISGTGEGGFILTDCSAEQGAIKFTKCEGIAISDSSRFSMYGGEIKYATQATGSTGFAVGVDMAAHSKFNMYGGKITEFPDIKNISYYEGVSVNEGSLFNMYGGEISVGDKATAVVTKGYFNMYGGEIKNNRETSGKYKAGGVYVCEGENAKFAMSGGEIKNNSGTVTGGVYSEGSVTISGNVKIQDNSSNNVTSNLYIPSKKTVEFTDIGDDAKIGITTERKPSTTASILFGSGTVANFENKIVSDSSKYIVVNGDTLKVKVEKVAPTLTTIPTAAATYGQKLSELTLTNPNGNTGGTWQWMDSTQSVGEVSDTEKTFKARFVPYNTDAYTTVENKDIRVMVYPKTLTNDMIKIDGTQPTYTGSALDASFAVYDGETPLEKGTDYKIVSGGKATKVEATTLTIEGIGNYARTATATWSLKKAEPSVNDFDITAPEKVKYGAAVNVVTPTVKNGIVGMGSVDKVYYVGTGDTTYTKSETAPTEVGTYAVTFDVAEGENYTAASGLEIGALTIEKATGAGGGAVGGAIFVPNVEKPKITVDETQGEVELSSDGATATVKPKDGYEIDSITVNGKDQGTADKITGLKTGDTVIVTFKKKDDGSDSTGEIADIQAQLSKIQLVARSAKTSKKNTKITIKTDEETQGFIKALNSSGYDVKYKYYRSTKKSARYVAKVTKSGKSYINTSGKRGSMYYYKARLQVYDANGRLIAQTALKQCKYANRQWSKQ